MCIVLHSWKSVSSDLLTQKPVLRENRFHQLSLHHNPSRCVSYHISLSGPEPHLRTSLLWIDVFLDDVL